MSEEYIKKEILKKEIANRFKTFRKSIKNTQHELADELKVNQSVITNIEKGKFLPGVGLQYYLYDQYHLNLNWLITGKDDMIIPSVVKQKNVDIPIILWHIDESDPRFEVYVELLNLMRIQEVERIILGKIAEVKLIAKEEIKSFYEGQ